MQYEDYKNPMETVEDEINIREEFEKYAYYWKWFVFSGILAIMVAFVYFRYAPDKYEVKTTILIEDEESGMASELVAFEDLGLLGGANAVIEDEMELLKSRTLMEKVVKKLEANVFYFSQRDIKRTGLHSSQTPIKVNFFEKGKEFYSRDTLFAVKVKSSTEFVLEDEDGNEVSTYAFGENVQSKMGNFTITPQHIENLEEEIEIGIEIKPLARVIENLRKKILIEALNEDANVIQLSLVSPVRLKSIELLNTLVDQYNKDAVVFKGMVAKSTKEFIEGRLTIINKDLDLVELGAESFKTKNKLTDIASEASLALQTKSQVEKNIIDLTTELKLVEYVQDHVQKNSEDLIPVNLGLSKEGLNQSTQKYNELLLERNRILQSSSALNPVIVNLNNQIKNVRSSISQSLMNLESSLQISLEDVRQEENRLISKMAAVPQQEREFRDIQRQQQIIESLYLFLLEKREENAIALAVTAPNARIIDRAYASIKPVSPKKKLVLAGALFIGLLIPLAVLYIREVFDTKLHTRKDMEQIVKAPVLGDIPINETDENIVVKEGSRSSAAEAFRLLRTNLDFMLTGVESECKSLFVTSTISGEGKSFVSVNLACTLALSGKKVALVGMDLRAPKLLDYIGSYNLKGITSYIKDSAVQLEDIKIAIKGYENLDAFASGVIPPNPAELLMHPRVEELFEKLRENYDYLVVDTAPVNLVTDTLMISKYADSFVFVARAGFLDKRLLATPQHLYKDKRLPNMAMLINGVDYKRGYGYGAYGSYGTYGPYGYGATDEKKPWWKRMF